MAALTWTMGLSLPGRSAGIGLGGEVRQTLHDAWTKYLAALGRSGLVVLVVEDIHWASEPLLDLLTDVIDGLEDTSVLVALPVPSRASRHEAVMGNRPPERLVAALWRR